MERCQLKADVILSSEFWLVRQMKRTSILSGWVCKFSTYFWQTAPATETVPIQKQWLRGIFLLISITRQRWQSGGRNNLQQSIYFIEVPMWPPVCEKVKMNIQEMFWQNWTKSKAVKLLLWNTETVASFSVQSKTERLKRAAQLWTTSNQILDQTARLTDNT